MTDYQNHILADLASVFTPDGRIEHRGEFRLLDLVVILWPIAAYPQLPASSVPTVCANPRRLTSRGCRR